MPPTSDPSNVPSLRTQLSREACSMVRHLVTNGRRVPPALLQAADRFETAVLQGADVDMAALAATHERLSRLVAPAKPGTLYLLDFSFHQQGRKPSSLGPIKLVRDLVKVAMVCVAFFIVLSVIAVIETHPEARVMLGSNDYVVLRVILERVFWLSAAGIGAAFGMLFQLNEQILGRTYDPDETPSYWVKFFLGLVAGFILVALVPVDATPDNGAEALGPPTIALLGGFSASAVYRILTRMVEALESIFTGGAKEQVASAERAATSRAAEETTQVRMNVAGQLMDIHQQLAAGMPSDQAAARLKQVVSSLVPASDEYPGAAESAPQPAAPDKVPALVVVTAPADASAPADAQPAPDAGGDADAQSASDGSPPPPAG